MMTRIEMQELLEDIIGNSNVYFQAPPNVGMKYPAILYSFENFDRRDADNKPYILSGRWQITHMYKSIKNDLKEKFIFEIPNCSFDRRIVADGIYNDYYIITL